MKKPENPAKVFLGRYRGYIGMIDSIRKAIDDAMERAYNIGVSLKEIKVLSSPAEHDPMARDICNAVDACETLYKYKAEADQALQEIMTAIYSIQDPKGRDLLIRRYINNDNFAKIAQDMNYSEPAVYMIHGRALIGINEWLNRKAGS